MSEADERRARARRAQSAMRPHAERRSRRGALLVAASLLLPAFPARSFAEGTRKALAPTASPEAQAAARDHFQRARELYQAGSYHEAIAELEAARALDPYAKDLVFNLGVVSEKLGNIDEALRHFRHYVEMDLQPAERARAESMIKRLEGAKREVKPEERAAPQAPQTPQQGERAAEPPPHGRIDVLTLSAAVIAVGGIAVGTVFGIKALSDNPQSDGQYASYSVYLREQNDAASAHREARVADVAFVVGGAALVAAAALFFLRTKDPKATQSVGVSAAPLAGGARAFVGGSF